MPCLTENYDVAVVGAGHAGCEAALASARLGLETIVFTVSVDSIALIAVQPECRRKLEGPLGARAGCARRRDGKKYR